MKRAADAPRVLLDTSAFIRFAEVGTKALAKLGRYLGTKAAVTGEVQFELVNNSKRFAALQNLPRLGWPPPPPLTLTPQRREELVDLKRAQDGGHRLQDLGEISTVLMAQELGEALVVMDDNFGKRLCAFRQVPRISTAQLVAEMVAAGSLPEDMGLDVFERATPHGVGRPEFERSVREASVAVGS